VFQLSNYDYNYNYFNNVINCNWLQCNCNSYFCNQLPITRSMLCQQLQHLFRGVLVKSEKSCFQKGANYCPRSWRTLFFLRTLFSLSKSEHEDTIGQIIIIVPESLQIASGVDCVCSPETIHKNRCNLLAYRIRGEHYVRPDAISCDIGNWESNCNCNHYNIC